MNRFDWRVWLGIGIGGAALAAIWCSNWFRAAPDQDAEEQKRRSHINQIGRIAEGQILEVLDVPTAEVQAAAPALFTRTAKISGDGRRKLICYSYSISGVSYKTAQDITNVEGPSDQQHLVPGRPASIKYDPSNPGDSIVLTDDWSGLH